MGQTSIEWTATYNADGTVTPGKTWSPLRAIVRKDAAAIATAKGYTSLVKIAERMAGHVGPHCERVSHGCDNCYSDSNNHRCLPANGTGLPFDRRARDLIEPFMDRNILLQPLKWKRACKAFVENQSDLFGEWNSDEMIDQIFAIMSLCPHITFQVLTKRHFRMVNYMCHIDSTLRKAEIAEQAKRLHFAVTPFKLPDESIFDGGAVARGEPWNIHAWPLPNVWIGCSIEDQKTADERSAILRQVPAAIRFISQEPQLSDIQWTPETLSGISWLVQGGESGRGARPFDIAWARSTRDQCAAAGTSYFLKQLGAVPIVSHGGKLGKREDGGFVVGKCAGVNGNAVSLALYDHKGGNWDEWPKDLRVRQFPA